MEEAKTFQREFSNLRLMMTRMSNKLSEKTGFDPSKVGREGGREGGGSRPVLPGRLFFGQLTLVSFILFFFFYFFLFFLFFLFLFFLSSFFFSSQ